MKQVWGWCIVFVSFVTLHASAASTDCGPLPSNSFTEVVNPKVEYRDQDKVQYKCVEDYETVSGSRSIQCVNGKWTALRLECQKRLCGHLELPNGELDYSTGNAVGDKVQAMCHEGYTLAGMEYMLCTKHGWSGDSSCVEITSCHDPSVANGVMTSGNAEVYHFGVSVNFACSQGFSLIGSQQITCGENGQWQPQPPRCLKRVTHCPELNIPNAKYGGRKRLGSVVEITCKKGFQRKGPANVTCSQEGKWVDEIPTCSSGPPMLTQNHRDVSESRMQGRQCGEPDYLSNFNLKDQYRGKTSFPDGVRVRYECDVGYVWANGSPYRTCKGGRWTDLPMSCERKSCGSAGEVLNGQFMYTGVEFGDSATAICDEGHQLVGQSIRRCLNGGWDGRVAVCEAVQCEDPPEAPSVVQSGTMEAPYIYGSVISYHCRVGKLIGPSMIYCTKDGAWSATPPECKDVSCAIPRFNNAVRTMPVKYRYEVGDRVTFRCRRGNQQGTITCGLDGNWSRLAFLCR